MTDSVFPWAMLLHEAGLILAHLSRNFVDYLVHGRVHVSALGCGFERNVVVTMQNHLSRVTVFLDVQDHLYFDNLRIIKVKARQPAAAILFHCFRDADVPPRHLDWWICILYLHIWALSNFALGRSPSAISWEPAETVPGVKENVSERGLKVLAAGNISSWLHPKAFTEIELSTNWIINQEFAGALAFDSSIKNKISTVHDLQRLANIVIRDQDRQT